MNWKRLESDPVTGQHEVAVYSEETEQEGLIKIRWTSGGPQYYGNVFSPVAGILDRQPQVVS